MKLQTVESKRENETNGLKLELVNLEELAKDKPVSQ